MKKTVKSLIVAASVAAIAGIGAVSFAAWNAGDVENATVPGSTATIVTDAGEIKVTGNNITDDVKLLPYDQVTQIGDNVKMQTFTVSYEAAENGATAEDYIFTMSLNDDNSLALYYKLGTVAEAPEAVEGGAAPDGWTLFDEAVELDLENDQIVNIILVSNDYAADGDTAYTITISAESK